MKRILLLLGFVALAVSCDKEWVEKFWQVRLDGTYSMADHRNVIEGPEPGLGVLCASFTIETGEDGEQRYAVITGCWNSTGKVIGLNIKFDPVTVTKDDGTELHYTFGIFEGHRDLYMITGTYEVKGVVPDMFGKLVDYKAKGDFDARKIVNN